MTRACHRVARPAAGLHCASQSPFISCYLGWSCGLPESGVVIGAAIGGGFVLITAALVLFTAKSAPSTTMAVVLGGWLLKVVLLIVVLMIIRDLEFYDTMAMFITVVLAMIAVLGTEVWGIITSRVTYIS